MHPLLATLNGPKELNKSTCSQLLLTYDRKTKKFLPPRPPPKQERRQLLAVASKWDVSGDPAQSRVGLRRKIPITSCWGSPLSAWDFDLVQELLQPPLAAAMMPETTKLQALDIFINALATEILSRIWMWDQ